MDSITIFDLGWKACFTVVVVLAMFLSMIFTKIKVEIAFLSTISALLISGVLDFESSFGGFSSSSVVVIAILFMVIAGLTHTGVLNWVVKHLMGTPKTLSGAIARLMIPVAFLSSLLANTTVVALFVNVVKLWSNKLHIAPSKLLIPLSYASGMGGICTLIGTPPNLIISGLYTEETGIQLSILTPTICGLFCMAVGVLSMIAMQKLLPVRKSPMEEGREEDFTAELTVPSNSPYVGMTIAELREEKKLGIDNAQIVAIRRFDNYIVTPINNEEFVMGGDRMVVSGNVESILRISQTCNFPSPTLSGVLESEAQKRTGKKTVISSLILIAMVVLSATNILPLVDSCLLAAAAMLIFRCCNAEQALKAIDWNILIVFAGSIAIGKAIEDTGLAQLLTNRILQVCGTNPYVVLTGICFVGTFVTEFISNTAAGAMFYPIAMSAAKALGVNPLTFCVALMISVSSSFATPIGSPTHMLVYIPGGYRFTDFMRIGLLMNIIILAANIFITTIVFPL